MAENQLAGCYSNYCEIFAARKMENVFLMSLFYFVLFCSPLFWGIFFFSPPPPVSLEKSFLL